MPTDAPTVRVTATPAADSDRLTLSISIDLPTPPDIRSRADLIGLASARPKILAACSNSREVQAWNEIHVMIRASEEKLAAAVAVVAQREKRVELLQREYPTPELLQRIRDAQSEVATAVADRDVAQLDLTTLREQIPIRYCAAANTFAFADTRFVSPLMLASDPPVTAAAARLDESCESLRVIVEKAVADYILGPGADLLVAKRVRRELWGDHGATADQVREQVLGKPPPGAVSGGGRMFKVVAVAPPPPPPAPLPTNRIEAIVYR